MASFFEKLKKGMGIEKTTEETLEENKVVAPKKTKVKKPKKLEIKTMAIQETQEEPKKKEEKTEEEKSAPLPDAPEKQEEEKKEEKKETWPAFSKKEQIGQLAIDVYQTENDLIIQSAIAGVKPENLDILMEKDILTIKGIREKPLEEKGDYFSQECYWGPFSREVIMPTEVDPNQVMAEIKDGILTVRIPRIQREKKRRITVRGN